MHKGINNSVIIESNTTVPTKKQKNQKSTLPSGNGTKIGTYMTGNISMDNTFLGGEKKQKWPQQLTQDQINYITNFKNADTSIPMKQQ